MNTLAKALFLCFLLPVPCFGENFTVDYAKIGDFPAPRTHFAVTVDKNHIWLFGGYNNGPKSDIWRMDYDGNWEKHSDSSIWSKRYTHAAINFRGKIFLLGGTYLGGDKFPEFPHTGNNDVWVWDSNGAWEILADESPWLPRLNPQLIEFNEGIFLLGGQYWSNYTLSGLNDVWKSQDGISWVLLEPNAPWVGRMNFGLYKRNRKVFVLGGRATDQKGGTLGDLWASNNGSQWEEISSPHAWQKRSNMAICMLDDFVIMHGGLDGTAHNSFNDLWISQDGYKWSLVPLTSTSQNPGRLFNHSIVKLKDRIFMFGGKDEKAHIQKTFGKLLLRNQICDRIIFMDWDKFL